MASLKKCNMELVFPKIDTLMELSYICFKDCFADFQLFTIIPDGSCAGYLEVVAQDMWWLGVGGNKT